MKMKITGTGSALPGAVVTNTQLTEWMDTSDEWIRERTGIAERRLSTGETVASLAAKACRKALEQAGRTAEEVDMILLATCSPEYLLPCCACQVQQEIGAVNAVAFDLNAACSGFLFGLTTANAYIQSGMYRRILVVGSEVLSKLMDWEDRSTCILFGDGAGAVLAEAVEDEETGAAGDRSEAAGGEAETAGNESGLTDGASGLIGSVQGSDGSRGMVLKCRERLIKNPLYTETAEETEAEAEGFFVEMDGQAVYRFATRQVPACIKEVLEKTGLSVEDIDLFILHQANVRIIEAVAKRLGADIGKFPMNLDRVGNMSSATIPVLLDGLSREGRLHRGDKLVLSGFGAGLTYGACVLVW